MCKYWRGEGDPVKWEVVEERGCLLAIPEPILPLVTGAGEALVLEHTPPRYSVIEV